MMKLFNPKQMIASRVAQELKDGDVVNLGIGIPTMVANYIPENIHVFLHSENGFIGLGPLQGEIDPDLVNAGATPAGIIPGAAMFDSSMSFQLIRGGHVNIAVLGGLQVDQEGNLANWMVPGKMISGMGGAMDLVTGAEKVIIAMEHTAKDGSPKILKQCTFPLTGRKVVSMIVTELAVFSVMENGLVLEELQEGATLEILKEKTEAEFTISPYLESKLSFVS